ncbi:unnamed protein product [Arctia plantaginis]|uniref:Uncharacterized protein n=1 Tax=Arctia plantaginis TaxID=874455 RepID=A0A8S0Z2V2_ARCPL|nr:unnamed protein product [Arctia plantaginis]
MLSSTTSTICHLNLEKLDDHITITKNCKRRGLKASVRLAERASLRAPSRQQHLGFWCVPCLKSHERTPMDDAPAFTYR